MKHMRTALCLSLTGMLLFAAPHANASGAKLVLGTKVEKHVIQNERDHFAFHDGQVWAQIEIKPSVDGHVTFVWTRDGHPYSEFKVITKQSPHYRTQAFVTARPGKWHVAVKSDANAVLAEKDFVVDGVEQHHNVLSKPEADVLNHAEKSPATQEKVVSGVTTEASKAIHPTAPKLEAKNSDKPADAKPAAEKSVELKPVELKPAETKPAETKPAEIKPTETKPAETKPTETKPAKTKPIDLKPELPKA